VYENIRKIEIEAQRLGAEKGRCTLRGDAEGRAAIDRRLAVLRARKAILVAVGDMTLTADEVAEIIATIKAVAA
jgi:hypothetical protein